jgi:hypothetical protein
MDTSLPVAMHFFVGSHSNTARGQRGTAVSLIVRQF